MTRLQARVARAWTRDAAQRLRLARALGRPAPGLVLLDEAFRGVPEDRGSGAAGRVPLRGGALQRWSASPTTSRRLGRSIGCWWSRTGGSSRTAVPAALAAEPGAVVWRALERAEARLRRPCRSRRPGPTPRGSPSLPVNPVPPRRAPGGRRPGRLSRSPLVPCSRAPRPPPRFVLGASALGDGLARSDGGLSGLVGGPGAAAHLRVALRRRRTYCRPCRGRARAEVARARARPDPPPGTRGTAQATDPDGDWAAYSISSRSRAWRWVPAPW